MRWLKDQGCINSYDDYVALPYRVLADARLVMAAEAAAAQRNRARAQQNGGRRGLGR